MVDYVSTIRESTIISLIQHFEADFLWKVSLKILNSGLILKTFTHANTNTTFEFIHIMSKRAPYGCTTVGA